MNGISWQIISSLLPWSSRWIRCIWCFGMQPSIPPSMPPPTSIPTISSLIFSAYSLCSSPPFSSRGGWALSRSLRWRWWRSLRLRWTSRSVSSVYFGLFRHQSHHWRRNHHYLPVRVHLRRANQEIRMRGRVVEPLWRKGKVLYNDHEGYWPGAVHHTLVQLQLNNHEGRLVLPRKLKLQLHLEYYYAHRQCLHPDVFGLFVGYWHHHRPEDSRGKDSPGQVH